MTPPTNTPVPRPLAEVRAYLRVEHRKHPCVECGQDVCDIARLLDALDAAEGERRVLEEKYSSALREEAATRRRFESYAEQLTDTNVELAELRDAAEGAERALEQAAQLLAIEGRISRPNGIFETHRMDRGSVQKFREDARAALATLRKVRES